MGKSRVFNPKSQIFEFFAKCVLDIKVSTTVMQLNKWGWVKELDRVGNSDNFNFSVCVWGGGGGPSFLQVCYMRSARR